MQKAVKGALIGCGGILVLLVFALIALIVVSNPSKALKHKFDTFRLDPEACMRAFNGSTEANFTHVWILASPDLKAWWDPNGMRAEADLIVDSNDPRIIEALLESSRYSTRSSDHVRTLSEGRIYHALLFDEVNEIYAHLRFAFRSKQSDGTTVFSLTTENNGASPIKDCPGFSEFETLWLSRKKIKRENKSEMATPRKPSD